MNWFVSYAAASNAIKDSAKRWSRGHAGKEVDMCQTKYESEGGSGVECQSVRVVGVDAQCCPGSAGCPRELSRQGHSAVMHGFKLTLAPEPSEILTTSSSSAT